MRGGELIELISDLGGGKTTLVRGIARGFGSTDKVASPTFTVSKEYQSGKKRIVHYDFYRLNDPGILQFELAESLEDPAAVSIIEWADIVHDVLPQDVLRITIASGAHESERTITLNAGTKHKHVVEILKEQG